MKSVAPVAPVANLLTALAEQIMQAAQLRAETRATRETTRYVIRQCAEALADYIGGQTDKVSAKAEIITAVSELKSPNADVRGVWKSALKDLETVLAIRARIAKG